MLLASPALASTPALHLIQFEDAAPSTAPLLAPEAAVLPYSFHLPALKFQGELPSLPLPLPAVPDEGGGAGVSSDVQPLLAILLSLIVGFGTGHLVVRDREGFILFLIVDVVIIALGGILTAVVTPLWFLGYGGLSGLALLISHLIQVLDVYGKAYGTKLLDRTRDSMILAAPPPVGPDQLLQGGTSRVLRFAF
jgi:hypothetical protein